MFWGQSGNETVNIYPLNKFYRAFKYILSVHATTLPIFESISMPVHTLSICLHARLASF